MLAHPGDEVIVGDIVGGEAEHDHDGIHLGGLQLKTIEAQKKVQRTEARALVSIDEGVVACDGDRIQRSKFGCIRVAVAGVIDRPGERALQQSFVAEAIRSRRSSRDQLIVQGEDRSRGSQMVIVI